VIIGLVEVIFLLTFLSARGTHAAMIQAITEMEAAVREAAQREALLLEARRELERALKVGGPGRFTEQELGGYRLGVLRGRGAMGDIYEAVPVDGGDKVAVKLLHREVLRDGEQVRRFLREAQLAGSIDEPNVIRVIDVGSADAPVPYLVMELLDGNDLATELREHQRLTPAYVVDMMRQICHGVEAAHRAGIVHRDLKPRNLFRIETPDGMPQWKVLDFGVARLIDAGATLTRGQAVGTPSYMSPEQARGRECDHRADIFALGLVAYRALTGRPAYTGREVPQILYDVVHAMPPRPSAVASLPPEVDHVLAIALAKLAKHRFDNAGELATALEDALSGEISDEHRELAVALTDRYPWGEVAS
jgi:serine/threonine-protein kinase